MYVSPVQFFSNCFYGVSLSSTPLSRKPIFLHDLIICAESMKGHVHDGQVVGHVQGLGREGQERHPLTASWWLWRGKDLCSTCINISILSYHMQLSLPKFHQANWHGLSCSQPNGKTPALCQSHSGSPKNVVFCTSRGKGFPKIALQTGNRSDSEDGPKYPM